MSTFLNISIGSPNLLNCGKSMFFRSNANPVTTFSIFWILTDLAADVNMIGLPSALAYFKLSMYISSWYSKDFSTNKSYFVPINTGTISGFSLAILVSFHHLSTFTSDSFFVRSKQ
ncbi:hypothetical protein WICPIJ_005330 [Wickerhamomyces pijperi]|uniref:Uncharacterized protein n=1 Tax=Wickerhamomyces pijperi TaxID=599730 RepID=A0A9P8Q446_WICPI|nr:hypothetical protein WICPIJ_005330 [Wickerhamomyces pijperi]